MASSGLPTPPEPERSGSALRRTRTIRPCTGEPVRETRLLLRNAGPPGYAPSTFSGFNKAELQFVTVPVTLVVRISTVMSRSREPQQLVRLNSTTSKMAISFVSVTCQNGAGSVPRVWVKSPKLLLMARLAVNVLLIVLSTALPLGATLTGRPTAWFVSKPTAGGTAPVVQLPPGT